MLSVSAGHVLTLINWVSPRFELRVNTKPGFEFSFEVCCVLHEEAVTLNT